MTRARDLANIADGTFTATDLDLSGTLTVSGDANFDSGTLFVDVSANNVGIGTTTVNEKLVLGSADSGSNFLQITNSTTTAADNRGFYVGIDANENARIIQRENADMFFSTNNTEVMTLDASGNVGIGTTSPSESLETTGNIQIKYVGQNTDPSGARYLIFNNTDTTLVADQPLGGLSWVNNDASATAGEAAYVKAYAANNTGTSELRFGTGTQNGATERMRIDSSGNLLVGTTSMGLGTHRSYFQNNATNSCSAFVNVTGTANTTSTISLYHGAASGATSAKMASFINQAGSTVGTIESTGSATSYNISSDYRLKDVDGPITNSGAYIDALKPVQGSWKADGSRFVGLIAHEVQEVSETQIATGEKDGEEMQGMDYSAPELIANLIAEIQSLRARVAQLEGA